MELYRGCRVLLLGAVLSSAACLGQAAPTQPELAAPVAAIESGSAVMDTSYCPAISAGGPQLSLVSKLCDFALTYRQQLPDFIAQQTTTAREGFSQNIITARVTFRQGQEHYSHVTINGRPAGRFLGTSTPPKNLRLSSTGEFGSLLVDLFASPAAVQFFAEYEVRWFEEPVSSDDLEGLRLVRDRAPAAMDIAAGEYGYDIFYFRCMLAAEAVDVQQADITRCGGVTALLQVGALCEAYNLPLSGHTAPALHALVGCAIPAFRNLEYFHDHVRIERMFFEGFPQLVNGELRPDLSRHGIGLELKRADADRYAA